MQLLSIVALASLAAVVSAELRGVHYVNGYKQSGKRALNRRAQLQYFGGPVISNVEVHPIFYGSNVADTSKINSFYAGVTNSVYFDWLSEYNTPTQSIGRGSAVSGISVAGSSSSALTDAQLQTFLKGLVSAGTISPNANTYYPIHFDPKYSITMSDGSASCQVFCAYHGTIDISSISSTKYLYYGVIPDQYGACAGGCGSDATQFNNLCSVSSHELIETVTDAAVGLATANASPLAWYDTTNGEIGDICNASQGTVKGGDGVTYTVQKEWSNKQGACIISTAGPAPTSTAKATSTSAVKTTSTATATAKSSSTAKATSTPASTCAHSVCTTGVALSSSCSACAAAVIAQDSFCGRTSWDSVCVSEVAQFCSGVTC